jgi:hypothetical protein
MLLRLKLVIGNYICLTIRFVPCRLSVIENNDIGFIFGLDNMRSHRCNIDLGRYSLNFPDAGIEIKFLSDGEIMKIKQLREDEEIMQDIDKTL